MQNAGFRQSMGLLHSWGGLFAGWIGFAIFLTGTLAVFDDEITRWTSPELTVAAPATQADVIAVLRAMDARSPTYWFASMPQDRAPAMRVIWKNAAGTIQRSQVDAATGQPIEARTTGGGGFFTHFHYTLHAGDTGTWIVAAVSVAMLVAMLSGIVVHRRIFSDFFTFRPRAAAQRSWLDLHNLMAVLALPFLLMIVYTGLTIKSRTYLPIAAGPRPSSPTAPPAPPVSTGAVAIDLTTLFARAEQVLGVGRIAFITVREEKDGRVFVASRAIDDRLNLSTDTATFDRVNGTLLGTTQVDQPAYLTQRVFAGLHFGQFGGLAVRWLYFILGLCGTVMIGAGLILFSIKRPGRLIGAITVAAVTGLVGACVAHLVAARWLPFDAADREGNEVLAFFGLWGLALAHAAVRPWIAACREQAAVIAAATGLMAAGDTAAVALASYRTDAAHWWVVAMLIAAAMVFGWLAARLPALVRDRRTARSLSAETSAC